MSSPERCNGMSGDTTHVLIVDNHDSFVYNIVGLLRLCKEKSGRPLRWTVVRNEAVATVSLPMYDAVILSPGPGIPSEASGLTDLIGECAGKKPLLGICLGCQAIAEYYGGSLQRLQNPRHGHQTVLTDVDSGDALMKCFAAPASARVGRYHSWVVAEDSLPGCLVVTARDEDGHIMALRHVEHNVYGVQFHPESIMTDSGVEMLEAFLWCAGAK